MVGACGVSELDVVDRFDGTYVVERLEIDGAAIDVGSPPPVIEIDTATATVRGRTTCRLFLGSYTLTDTPDGEGEASFTLPGLGPEDCDGTEADLEAALLDVLEGVERWRADGADLELFSLDGSRRTVLAPAN